MRLADPRPSLCTVCCNAGDENTRFVDTGAWREGPLVRDRETGEIALDPAGAMISLDGIDVCDACVRAMADLIGFKPELHQRQFVEIRRLELGLEHWRDTAKRKEDELARQREYITQLETSLGSRVKPQRSRRAA